MIESVHSGENSYHDLDFILAKETNPDGKQF